MNNETYPRDSVAPQSAVSRGSEIGCPHAAAGCGNAVPGVGVVSALVDPVVGVVSALVGPSGEVVSALVGPSVSAEVATVLVPALEHDVINRIPTAVPTYFRRDTDLGSTVGTRRR